MKSPTDSSTEIEYPGSDGKPMAESMTTLSSRNSGARSRRHNEPISSGSIGGSGFSSPASNAAALSCLKSSGPTL